MKFMNIKKIAAVIFLILPLLIAGCEGDTGPQGAAGPPGEDGEGAYISDYTYVGESGSACTHCHGSTVEQMALTNHNQALDSLTGDNLANPYCLQCHTTGWDRHVSYGSDDWMTAENPDVNGYDDYYGVEGEVAEMRREHLEGVQCESCHGTMGPDFNDHAPDVSFATVVGQNFPDDIVSVCYQCHSTQFEGPEGDFTGGYAGSGHAGAAGGNLDDFNNEHYAHLSSCNGCHTSEGFIAANDPSFATYEFGATANFIGCVTCHDPHMGSGGDGNEAQVRNIGTVYVSYTFPYAEGDAEVPAMSDKETGQLCAQCHHARRDTDNVLSQIANGYAHFGPHHSAQMDLYIGAGSYEIPDVDYADDRSHPHQNASKACVTCHMERETMLHGELQGHAFHNFEPEVGTNCTGCHGEDFVEADLTDYQATTEGLMNDLATRFGYDDYHQMEEEWDSTADAVTTWEREAAYAMYFIIGDGSLGVHNPSYAAKLLNEAITLYDANIEMKNF